MLSVLFLKKINHENPNKKITEDEDARDHLRELRVLRG